MATICLLIDHHHRLDGRDQLATSVAFAMWLISLTLEAPRADATRLRLLLRFAAALADSAA